MGRLVKLPNFGLRDLVVRVRDNRMSHIYIGLIVSDVFISKLVFQDIEIRTEYVQSAFSLVKHCKDKNHNP